jgi:hypothetical protein
MIITFSPCLVEDRNLMSNKVIIDQLTAAYGISELHSAIFIAPKRPFATVS